jgi:hypothetical protein
MQTLNFTNQRLDFMMYSSSVSKIYDYFLFQASLDKKTQFLEGHRSRAWNIISKSGNSSLFYYACGPLLDDKVHVLTMIFWFSALRQRNGDSRT